MRRATAASVCSSSMLVIRKAEPRDVPQMLAFIRELAEYEKEPQAVVATEEDLLRDGVGQSPRYFCLVADWEGTPAGVAFFFHNFSAWVGGVGVCLQGFVFEPRPAGGGIR